MIFFRSSLYKNPVLVYGSDVKLIARVHSEWLADKNGLLVDHSNQFPDCIVVFHDFKI
jgi:hypothetical protein